MMMKMSLTRRWPAAVRWENLARPFQVGVRRALIEAVVVAGILSLLAGPLSAIWLVPERAQDVTLGS